MSNEPLSPKMSACLSQLAEHNTTEIRPGRNHLVWKALEKRGLITFRAKEGYMTNHGFVWTVYEASITQAGQEALHGQCGQIQ